ncbi:GerAB/ArcD/ProY family transporter [Pontibacillus marinus]|uniref:Spore germination protein n=1 Tax=Pontibacillus marinus BH030004 = DSM 16465 TaxID=1385511 RepID=A0A0A5HHZ7_9BACI|nr:GerAB/ArcD/ProY family transporter [Pontibacillus marinus]KGX83282.1 spore germination protein [Pontibacillus marinus BH030004 = DSM 16465]
MRINLDISKGTQIQAFYLFFLIHTMQVGAGLMGVTTHIFQAAKHDAWISILIAGLWMHLIIFVMIKMLEQYQNTDLFGIQRDVFGKWINLVLGTCITIYIFVVIMTVILNYVEVVQVYLFPTMPTWLISFFLLSLSLYAALGGIRVVVGAAFLFFLITIGLSLFLSKPITLMDMNHFFPILNVSLSELIQGTYKTTYTFLGLEVLLFAYPYIKNKNKAHLSAQLGVLLTVIITFSVVFVTIGYFSPDQINRLIWPTLSLFKIIRLPFIERFDVIAVALWMLIILPNIIIFTWVLSHCFKRLYGAREKYAIYIVTILLFIFSSIFQYRININTLTDISAKVGFYIVFVYPLILFPIVWIKKKLQRKRGEHS